MGDAPPAGTVAGAAAPATAADRVLAHLAPALADAAAAAAAAAAPAHAADRAFPTVPPLDWLLRAARDWRRAQREAGAPAGSAPAATDAAPPAPAAPHADSLLDILRASRTFGAPDSADGMAAALGLAPLLAGLAGSLQRPLPDAAELGRRRARITAAVDAAWSMEAVAKGVRCAKEGASPSSRAALPAAAAALQQRSRRPAGRSRGAPP